ncbi:hypothetical protein J6590_084493 [Homalodisca vitripennis]|nr:hypothetical protein J6590_084493 [Homalodisca vitripennis]
MKINRQRLFSDSVEKGRRTDRLLRHETVCAWRSEEFEEKCGPGWVRGAGRQVRPAGTSTTADIGLMRASNPSHAVVVIGHLFFETAGAIGIASFAITDTALNFIAFRQANNKSLRDIIDDPFMT